MHRLVLVGTDVLEIVRMLTFATGTSSQVSSGLLPTDNNASEPEPEMWRDRKLLPETYLEIR